MASTPVKLQWMKAWRRSRGDRANAQRASSLPAVGGVGGGVIDGGVAVF